MRVPTPIFTREHGAWAVLLIPVFTGAGIIGRGEIDHLFLVLSAVSFFLSYAPVQILLRLSPRVNSEPAQFFSAAFWGGTFVTLGLLFLAPLLARGYVLLIPVGMVAVILFFVNYLSSSRYGKTLPGDLIGMLALTLGAPAALYVGSGSLDGGSLRIWLLNFLFFASGAFYVHMLIGATKAKPQLFTARQKFQLGYPNLLYQGIMLGILGMLITMNSAPVSLLFAYLPIVAYAVYGTATLSSTKRYRFKRVGLILLGHSLLFAVIVVVVFS